MDKATHLLNAVNINEKRTRDPPPRRMCSTMCIHTKNPFKVYIMK